MRKSLTPKQKTVYGAISDLSHKKGSSPTYEELRKRLDYKRISSVQRHVDALREKGYLDSSSRGISTPFSTERVQIPLVGNIACGQPLLATENIEAYISYDATRLRGTAQDYFFLRAVGDSMNKTDIGGKTIDDGDYVLVKKQSTASSGNRVVALIGDEATIKRMVVAEGAIRLEPESKNQSNKPIIMFDDFAVQGVVKDVIKKGDK